MKKVLSLILALTLIIGMIPVAFANAETEAISVTYTFNNDQHKDSNGQNISGNYLENVSGVKKRTDFATTGGKWAYLGTTSASTYNDANKYFAGLSADQAGFNFSADSFATFKIKVSSDGEYAVSGFTAYLVRKLENVAIDMYIVPLPSNIASDSKVWGKITSTIVDSTTTYSRSDATAFKDLGITAAPLGTLSYYTTNASKVGSIDVSKFSTVEMNADTEYALIFHSKNEVRFDPASLTLTKKVATPTATLTAESNQTYNEGGIALIGKLTAADGITDITSQATNVIFESSNISVAKVDNDGIVTGVSAGTVDITATYTYEGKEYSATCSVTITKAEKDVTHNLGTNYMTEVSKTAAGDALDSSNRLSDMSFADEYSDITSGLWGIADDFSNCDMTLFPEYWRAYGKKGNYLTDSEGSRIALKLKVEYTGIYDIKARTTLSTNGAEADVYIIPINDNVTQITSNVLKSFPVLGRVSCVGESGNVVSPICTTRLEEGEYYVVFNMNSDNPVADDKGNQILIIRHIALTESTNVEDEAKPERVQISAPTIAVTTNLPNASINIMTLNEIGESFPLNAEDVEGYTFLGWKRGVANGENQIDGTAKFTDLKQNDVIKVYTNTFLTAIYEKNVPVVSDNPTIKFWNQDKAYLGEIAKNKIAALPEISLIGHDFLGWFTAPGKALELSSVTADTNAVASYVEKSYLDSDKKYDKVRVNGVDSEKMKYGEAVVCKDTNGTVTHWIRDGKIVSYDAEYTHYIWDGTVISSSYAQVDKKPLVVLENTTIDGASMIEYDGAGKQIVEVGILFGAAESTPVVGSTFDKYVSQRNGNHGQLAAKPIDESYTVARGYMIYKDGNNTYVIYSE